nr:turbo yfp [Fluorescent tagging vector pUC57-PS12-turbo-yfp]ADK12958.1 turbo yfp [Site-specific integration vector miniTn7-gat-yfp]ADK12966.1 turbo yfp [Site-specific integration vector miniTn7-kan-yfp]
MSSGALLFHGKIPYVVEMEGNVDGHTFSIRGKGYGDASVGKVDAQFICTTGDVPVPWSTLVTTLTYGAQCFAKYGPELKDFYKSCMPDGYVQERTITFEGDGNFKTRAEVTFENGSVYNRVKLNGQGFKKDGHVLGKNLEFNFTPHCLYIWGDQANHGLKSAFKICHEITGSKGDFIVADHTQMNTPIGGGPVHVPEYHHMSYHVKLSKDVTDHRDNMSLKETVRAVDCRKTYDFDAGSGDTS